MTGSAGRWRPSPRTSITWPARSGRPRSRRSASRWAPALVSHLDLAAGRLPADRARLRRAEVRPSPGPPAGSRTDPGRAGGQLRWGDPGLSPRLRRRGRRGRPGHRRDAGAAAAGRPATDADDRRFEADRYANLAAMAAVAVNTRWLSMLASPGDLSTRPWLAAPAAQFWVMPMTFHSMLSSQVEVGGGVLGGEGGLVGPIQILRIPRAGDTCDPDTVGGTRPAGRSRPGPRPCPPRPSPGR